MSEWLQALILISAGIGLGLICFVAGSWVMYRGKTVPGTGDGFLKDPKGDVFTVPNDKLADQPYDTSAAQDEENILKNTNRFLRVLGGEG